MEKVMTVEEIKRNLSTTSFGVETISGLVKRFKERRRYITSESYTVFGDILSFQPFDQEILEDIKEMIGEDIVMRMLDGNFRYQRSREKVLGRIGESHPYFLIYKESLIFRSVQEEIMGVRSYNGSFYLLSSISVNKAREFGGTCQIRIPFDSILKVNLLSGTVVVDTHNFWDKVEVSEKEERLWRLVL